MTMLQTLMRARSAAEPSQAAAQQHVLARDADATYWMSRYVERAEHIARLILVNSEVLMDVGDISNELVQRHWRSMLQIMDIADIPRSEGSLPQRIARHMTFDTENHNSLIRCITRARENARGIREVISSEMWEHLNVIYWAIRADETQVTFAETPDQLYQQIITGSMLFQGLTDQTLPHGQRWYFTQLGKYFERIIVTCRILKTKYEILSDTETTADTPLSNIHSMAILRSCGSVEAYRRMYLGELDPDNVAQFLVLEPSFPRSVRYCVQEAYQAIAAIRAEVRPRSVDPAERVLGRLHAQLEYAVGSELTQNLSGYLDRILDSVSEAARCVQRSYFLH